MIKINFQTNGDVFTGFECKGHSMSAPSGSDIVCAAVSSACLMAANTITEIIGVEADAAATDGYLRFAIKASPQPAQDIIKGLELHLKELEAQYPENIRINYTEE